MELTGIGEKNAEAFAPLMFGLKYSDFMLCAGAIEEGEAAGVACFSELGGSLMLNHIYVSEKFRRRGIGSALIRETLNELKSSNLVALHANYPEYAEDIHGLICSLDFKIFRDGTAYRTRVSDYLDSEITKKLLGGLPKNLVISLSEMTDSERADIKKELDDADLDPSVIDDSVFSGSLSLVSFDKKSQKPVALVLCQQDTDTVVLSYLINFSKDPGQLLDILKGLKIIAESEGITDKELIFLTMTDDMARLPEKLISSGDLLHREGEVISAIKMLSEERTIFAGLMKEK